MVNHFRRLVQEKLNSIADLESGEIIGDDLIEEGNYYFGYRIAINGRSYNLDYSDRRETITLTGYLSTKGGSLEKFDSFTDNIIKKLSELRIMCDTQDVTTLDTKIRKSIFTGFVSYNSLDGLLK